MINKDSTYLKININLVVIFLFCIIDLILVESSRFVLITISLGIIIPSIYILNPKNFTRILTYLLFFSSYILGKFLSSGFLMKYSFISRFLDTGLYNFISQNTGFFNLDILASLLSTTILFLPIMLYFEDNDKNLVSNILAIIVSSFLVFFILGQIIQTLIYILVCITSVLLSKSSEEINLSKNKYYDYYFSSKIKESQLKRMYKELISKQDINIENAILSERNRISRDIHDSLGHLTSRGILQIGAMIVSEEDDIKKNQLLILKNTLSQGMNEVRKSLHNLQNESLNLKTTIENIISDFNFPDVDFNFSINDEISLKYKYSIIYIVKESLTNIKKHSDATKIEISLIEMKNKIYIKIFDNGSNRDILGESDKSEFSGEGMGIFSMRTRVSELGGSIEINQENGFRIFISLDKSDI